MTSSILQLTLKKVTWCFYTYITDELSLVGLKEGLRQEKTPRFTYSIVSYNNKEIFFEKMMVIKNGCYY